MYDKTIHRYERLLALTFLFHRKDWKSSIGKERLCQKVWKYKIFPLSLHIRTKNLNNGK
jgi:hypothetical protein